MKRLYKEILPTYNEFIHDDNPYRANPPDFGVLSKDYPELKQYIVYGESGKVFYKWSEPNATK